MSKLGFSTASLYIQANIVNRMLGFIILFFSSSIFSSTLENLDFNVELPNNWALISHSKEELRWVYQSSLGESRLTVSVLYYTAEPTHKQQEKIVKDFITARKQQTQIIDPSVSFNSDKLQEHPTGWVARYTEVSKKNRFAKNKTIATRIGVANFYLESFDDLKTFEYLSKEILSTTGFSS